MSQGNEAVRRRLAGGRNVRRTLATAAVAEAVGPITPSCEIFGVTKGKWSLVDLIVNCLEATGPADVVISTWTAAGADIAFAFGLLRDGRIRTLRFVVDFSFPSRQPAYCAALRERFGDGAIAVSKNHAKFTLIRNEVWNLAVRCSMNLNQNRRLESWEISDDKAMADYVAELVDDLFQTASGTRALAKKSAEHVRAFEQFGEALPVAVSAAALNSTDVKRYFGDCPLDNDVRRAGITYSR